MAQTASSVAFSSTTRGWNVLWMEPAGETKPGIDHWLCDMVHHAVGSGITWHRLVGRIGTIACVTGYSLWGARARLLSAINCIAGLWEDAAVYRVGVQASCAFVCRKREPVMLEASWFFHDRGTEEARHKACLSRHVYLGT